MNREQFVKQMGELLPGCKQESVQTWILFAQERVDEEQYVNFQPMEKTAAVEAWLDTLYAGLYGVKREFGPEIAVKTADLSSEQCCLYPYEMQRAAECLRAGVSARQIAAMIPEGELEGGEPLFPTMADFPVEHGYGIKRAETLIDRMEAEQGRAFFGSQEKDLLCNYAYHIEAFSKVEQLAQRLAAAQHELRYGLPDPKLKAEASAEIGRVDEIWRRQDETGVLEYRPVPFSAFDDCDLTGVEYLLETGEKLRFCPPSQDCYVSENQLADGTRTTPHIYRGVDCDEWGRPTAFHQEDGMRLESPYRAIGPEIGIRQEQVTYGLAGQHTEPGYILQNGTVLLESERDAYGNYLGGAGAGGMLLKTGKLYAPVLGEDGKPRGFQELQEAAYHYRDGKWQAADNYLKTAEMGAEQNYNQIDGIINNEPPRPSVLESLKWNKEAAAAQGRDAGQHKLHQGPER